MVFSDQHYNKARSASRQKAADPTQFNGSKQVNVDLQWPDDQKGAKAQAILRLTGKIGVD